jgi:hypothetical protein
MKSLRFITFETIIQHNRLVDLHEEGRNVLLLPESVPLYPSAQCYLHAACLTSYNNRHALWFCCLETHFLFIITSVGVFCEVETEGVSSFVSSK